MVAVSPCTTRTSSGRTPRPSAASCARTVACPCPFDWSPVATVTEPSGSTVTRDRVEVAGAGEAHVGGDLRRPPALLDEGAEADADVSAFGAELALALPERLVVHELSGAADRLGVAAAVVAAARRGDGRLAVGQAVPEPELQGVDAEQPRRVVDQRLAGGVAGRPADAPVGGARALVRRGGVDLVANGRDRVDAGQHRRRAERVDQARPRVPLMRAAVADQPPAEGEERRRPRRARARASQTTSFEWPLAARCS